MTGERKTWEPPAESPAEAGLASLALVSSDNDQRFALTPGSGTEGAAALEALKSSKARTVTVWGTAETLKGIDEVILYVEGHEDGDGK